MQLPQLAPVPLQSLEPVDQLAPYLQTLGDIGEALDAFERLADLVLSPSSDWSSASSPEPSVSSVSSVSSIAPASAASSFHYDSSESGRYQLASSPNYSDVPSSPPSSSASSFHCPSSPDAFSYTSASPNNCRPSYASQWQSIGPPSSLFYSSSSSSSSSFSSSRSSSSSCALSTYSTGCSSYQDSDDYLSSDQEECVARTAAGDKRRTSATGGGAKAKRAGRDEKRRQKNASAADRYRKKVKGRRCGLSAELEREQERNAKLRQSLEAKLVLYGEFADLLAHNTRDEHDWDLANLGSRSISNILDNILCPAELADKQQRVHLEQLLHHFKRVLATKSALVARQVPSETTTSWPCHI